MVLWWYLIESVWQRWTFDSEEWCGDAVSGMELVTRSLWRMVLTGGVDPLGEPCTVLVSLLVVYW